VAVPDESAAEHVSNAVRQMGFTASVSKDEPEKGTGKGTGKGVRAKLSLRKEDAKMDE